MGALNFGKKTAIITGALMVATAATAPAQTKAAPSLLGKTQPSATAKHGAKDVPLKKLGHAEAEKHMQQKKRGGPDNTSGMHTADMPAPFEDDTAPWLLEKNPSLKAMHATTWDGPPGKQKALEHEKKLGHNQKKLNIQHKKGVAPAP